MSVFATLRVCIIVSNRSSGRSCLEVPLGVLLFALAVPTPRAEIGLSLLEGYIEFQVFEELSI